MGCFQSKPSFTPNTTTNQPIQNKPNPVDQRLQKPGAIYLIRKNKQEQYQGNVPGGKMPIKLIFSLDKDTMNRDMDPKTLSFGVSFSDINDPKKFGSPSMVNDFNPDSSCFSSQIIADYYFEFDQTIKITTLLNGNPQKDVFFSFAKLNGSSNHTEVVPLLISNEVNPDFKLIVISDAISASINTPYFSHT